MNNLILAYLGDAVYELYVREYLLQKGIGKLKELQAKAIEFVSAENQAKILDELMDREFFSIKEVDIIKRGRNAHSHKSKSTDIITYKKSTGFETLIGYLYLNDKNRLNTVMKEVLK